MKFLVYSVAVLAAAVWLPPEVFAQTIVVYPAPEIANDVRFVDLVEILRTALDSTIPQYGPYEMRPSARVMNEARYMAEIEHHPTDRDINIVWSSTSTDKERHLLPIRIPLHKGLLGYRLCLIGDNNQQALSGVSSLEDLRSFTVGQGIGWGDIEIYASNGLKVVTSNYDNLFHMVASGRIDLFPRGVVEAFSEFDVYHKGLPKLTVDRELLIYYPWPYYFFFNRSDALLAARIESGLRAMIKDGRFDAIFHKYNDAWIQRVDFKHRRIIRLENRFLPAETPINDPKLWYDPFKE